MSTTLPALVDTRGRWHRVRGPVLLAAGVLAVSVLLHVRDPHQSGSWGLCPWLLLTGTHCPGCGGLRAVNDLTHGNVVAAASSNLLLVASVPVVALLWTRTLGDRWRGVTRRVDGRRTVLAAYGVLAVAVLFAVVRNTAYGAWLAP